MHCWTRNEQKLLDLVPSTKGSPLLSSDFLREYQAMLKSSFVDDLRGQVADGPGGQLWSAAQELAADHVRNYAAGRVDELGAKDPEAVLDFVFDGGEIDTAISSTVQDAETESWPADIASQTLEVRKASLILSESPRSESCAIRESDAGCGEHFTSRGERARR